MRLRLRAPRDTLVSQAVSLAVQLVSNGVENDTALERLRTDGGDVRTLAGAARETAALRDQPFPWPRVHSLLRAAANRGTIRNRSAEEIAVEEQSRELLGMSASDAFSYVVTLVPALQEIADGLSRTAAGWEGFSGSGEQMAAVTSSFNAIGELVGPDSHNPDALLATRLVRDVATRYLAEVAGIPSGPS